ncbi:MAG: ArsR family transcriptional regulator, partial [Gammaproteobacteria bacterium]|nr:ArsR family transcriptional regulator [Gammaproteobacteria bacterium]
KELQSWGLVHIVHVMGDRRDHFESLKDPWEMFTVIMEERKRREIDPTLTMLRACVLEGESDKTTPDDVKQRIHDVLEFMENISTWYEQMRHVPRPTLIKLFKLGSKVTNFISKKS